MDSEQQGLTIKQAAKELGISSDSVRRRIRSGSLQAFQVPTAQGYEWRIVLGAQAQGASRQLNGDDAQVGGEPMQSRQADSGALAAVVDRLSRENVELAGRCGFLQARVQQLEGEVKALQAPRDPEPEPEPEPSRTPLWRRLLGLSPA